LSTFYQIGIGAVIFIFVEDKMNSRNLIIIILALTGFTNASAQTTIPGGNVSGTWEASGSPYLIEGEITIPSGDSLVIEPGVDVIFQGHYKFIVNGWLEAIGTEQDSILFTPANTSEGWHGIRFIDAPDSSHLLFCLIQYGHTIWISFPDACGGGIYCENSNPVIAHCTIKENESGAYGGGIYCIASHPTICENTISQNRAASSLCGGGGIYLDENSCPLIIGNTISNNISAGYYADGAGLYCHNANPTLIANLILRNSVSGSTVHSGGGIYCENSNPYIVNCTIVGNSAWNYGGGIYCAQQSNPTLLNCILWGNTPQQIYLYQGSGIQATYSDIQGGWTGVGNITEYPIFVDITWSDYRLQWGSPCIDAGDPDPQYYDPDGTIADMGAFYYDQSTPVRILLTPHSAPIQIPPEGGPFNYTIQATNIDPLPQLVNVWCDAILPSGSVYGPVLGPVSVTLDSGVTIQRVRTQNVPGGAPPGTFSYNAYAVAGEDTSADSFNFVKLEGDGSEWMSGWSNFGDSFDTESNVQTTPTLPLTYSLGQNYPNPFNPSTTIPFSLPKPGKVCLNIYDLSGRLVASPVNGWRKTGYHEVTFDGSNLASGIYIYRIQAADYNESAKMILLK